ncbi:hypothetical protein BCV71DRAFT_201668 [Rhizopus microsporus]|uniref:Uncharacterized protein n=1 Tax=Rhizopus microsporus TaxID=58291 RepID=A0A1X0RX09_RHIZD|nr:hypothetical protein BCV71DRAFT_201668 [Rhizopus microsporus]
MTLKKYIASLFHTRQKSKNEVAAAKPEEPAASTEPVEQEEVTREEEKDIGINEKDLEFEESRNLLQSDIFNSTLDPVATFPQFEHLLIAKSGQSYRNPRYGHRTKTLSQTIRHRISMYRPNKKTIKRTLSTPDFFFRKSTECNTKLP